MKTTSKNLLIAVLALAASEMHAAVLTFDFKDPKGVNNVKFDLDAPLEAISGQSTGISGSVAFDPQNPSATAGKISVATASLVVGNPTMIEHMLSEGWLNAAAHPEISFEVKSLTNVSTEGSTTKADANGVLTLHGVSKDVTVPVTLSYLEGKLGARFGKPEMKGDLLVIRSKFEINRSDYGIKPGQMGEKVSEAIQISLSIAGAAAR